MNGVEAFEMALLASSNANSSFATFVTVTSAYLAATYIVGAKLSGPQAIGLSFIYATAGGLSALNTVADVEWWVVAATHAADLAPDGVASYGEFWLYGTAVLLVAIGIMSLYYMWFVQNHPPSE